MVAGSSPAGRASFIGLFGLNSPAITARYSTGEGERLHHVTLLWAGRNRTVVESRRMSLKTLLVLTVLVLISFPLMKWLRSDYLEFDQDRKAWHRRCDDYVGKVVAPADLATAESCKRELEQLMEYAERNGWR